MSKITQVGDSKYLIKLANISAVEWVSVTNELIGTVRWNHNTGDEIFVTTDLCDGKIVEQHFLKVEDRMDVHSFELHCTTGPAWVDLFNRDMEFWIRDKQYTAKEFCEVTNIDKKTVALWKLKYK